MQLTTNGCVRFFQLPFFLEMCVFPQHSKTLATNMKKYILLDCHDKYIYITKILPFHYETQ